MAVPTDVRAVLDEEHDDLRQLLIRLASAPANARLALVEEAGGLAARHFEAELEALRPGATVTAALTSDTDQAGDVLATGLVLDAIVALLRRPPDDPSFDASVAAAHAALETHVDRYRRQLLDPLAGTEPGQATVAGADDEGST